jgi:hypothetical protein
MSAWTRISHQKISASGVTAINFDSIPSTYTDLALVVSIRSTEGTVGSNAEIRFNGVSSGYSSRLLYGAGSGNGLSATGGSNRIQWAPTTAGNNSTTNTFGNALIYIPNYASSNAKSVSIDAVAENNATASRTDLNAALWNNSAAITSIAFTWEQAANFAIGSSATLYGITKGSSGGVTATNVPPPKATGGTITFVNNTFVHTFTSSGTFRPNQNLTNVEYIVIAGGGGGGAGDCAGGGGGGAGGYRSSVVGESSGGGASAESRLSLAANTNYTVTIGAGGAGEVRDSGTNGFKGNNSVFWNITSEGGGGGGGSSGGCGLTNGFAGGSGGGGSNNGTGGAGTTSQGFVGGQGRSNNASYSNGGGGGGAGGAGVRPGPTSERNGNGGVGVSSSITGTAVTRGGGGAGNDATGGTGGGGNGSTAGTANTGGGGGGGKTASAGAGGSGIVIVRYAA